MYDRQTVLKRFEPFKNFDFDTFSEEYLYHVLAYVPFYAGMDSKIVADKRDRILYYFFDYNRVSKYDSAMVDVMLKDNEMIKHKDKITACIYNAQRVKELASK